MVTQEGALSLGGRPGSLDHVLRDAGLSDFKAELEQLAMNTRGAPQWKRRGYVAARGARATAPRGFQEVPALETRSKFRTLIVQRDARPIGRKVVIARRQDYPFASFTNLRPAAALLPPCSSHRMMACCIKQEDRGGNRRWLPR